MIDLSKLWQTNTETTGTSEESDNMLCRYHDNKMVSVCNCDDVSMQKTCKYWDKASEYRPKAEYCAYWSRTDFVWNGYHMCKHAFANAEALHERKYHIK
jgi:hypothetical protein